MRTAVPRSDANQKECVLESDGCFRRVVRVQPSGVPVRQQLRLLLGHKRKLEHVRVMSALPPKVF